MSPEKMNNKGISSLDQSSVHAKNGLKSLAQAYVLVRHLFAQFLLGVRPCLQLMSVEDYSNSVLQHWWLPKTIQIF
jgi:hypothetical protein